MKDKDRKIVRSFRVRFAQVDGAHVIYYPRYLEMIADTFPEAALNRVPYDLSIRFLGSNRLGDNIRMIFEPNETGWSVSGSMKRESFSVVLTEKSADRPMEPYQSELASFETEQFTIRDWMCGPGGKLHLSRYYELISHAVEQWFEASLGMSFQELNVAENLGIPTVQLETKCTAFPRSGDPVSVALRPISVGESAAQLMTWLTGSGGVLLETRQVIVFADLSDRKIQSVRIPETLKCNMRSQLAAVPSH